MFIECDPKSCPSKSYCHNQRIKRGKFKIVTIKTAEDKGFGLFAAEFIPSDSFIVEYVGEVIDNTEFEDRCAQGHNYSFSLTKGFYIDSSNMGNDARYANHSCNPNARPEKWIGGKKMRIGLFANRNIVVVSQSIILYSYLLFNVVYSIRTFIICNK